MTSVVSAPGCGTATAAAPALRTVRVAQESVPATPFGVAVTPDGHWAFVSSLVSSQVSVFRLGPGAPMLTFEVQTRGSALGETLTPGGQYLLAADDNGGASVISVKRAEQDRGDALAGTLTFTHGSGATQVAVSPDGRFAFVSLEDTGQVAVFNLRQALATGFRGSYVVGTIAVGQDPVGLAFSPDGRWLYATSQLVAKAARPRSVEGGPGTLTVISVARAETDPAASVLTTVTAGCSPVRIVTSADGGVVWVTARGSDSLLAFSAARLRSDPAHSLLATVKVGEEPVGLALVRGGQRIVVADSNRYNAPGAQSSLAVVSVPAALAGRPALLGYLPAGGFPREMALTPDGRQLLVSNYDSGQLEVVDVGSVP